jgi:acyl-CoA synthetase (AMP-forming)/AMP-acid ligase II
VRAGDVVGVWLPNWTEWIVLEFALARLGAANLAINTRYSVHELVHLLGRGRPVGLAMPEEFLGLDFAGRLGAALAELRSTKPPWVMRFGGERGFATAAAAPDRATPASLVNYFTTSGSTGSPKLAGHSQAAVIEHARNSAAAFDLRAGDVFLCVLPLSGVFGFTPAMATLWAGGTCLLEPLFDAHAVLDDMAAFGVTHVAGGDDMLGRLMDAWRTDPCPLMAFRRGGIADFAGRAEAVVAWAERELGARISGVYGSSELLALTAINDPALPVAERVRGGGHPVSDEIEVRVADPDTGEPLAADEVGELQFRGYNVLEGYLGAPDGVPRAFTANGWFRSGDLGRLAADGRTFTYLCRAGDALRLRGFLVEPAEIEQFLMSHPAVDGARVVGVRADGGGDLAVAYVTLRTGAWTDGDQVLEFCRSRLAPFKLPAAVNVIDAFPVTSGTNGTKIRTAELRRWAAEQLAQRR